MFGDIGRLIILIGLFIIAIVDLIVLGYEARVLRESPGHGTPPKLEKYGELFVDGLKIFFASLLYLLIPLIQVIVGGAGMAAGFTSFSGSMVVPAVFVGATGVVVFLIGLVLLFVLLLILDIGLANMIKTGKFGRAFAFGEIFKIIGGIGCVKYIAWIIVTIIIGAVVYGLSRIPYIGWIISAIIQPIFGVFVFRSLGLLYNDGAPEGLKVQAPSVTTAPSGMTCTSCGTPLQPHHKFCPNCGAPVPAPPPPPAPATGTKFCISCGAKIPANALFYGSCGAKQT